MICQISDHIVVEPWDSYGWTPRNSELWERVLRTTARHLLLRGSAPKILKMIAISGGEGLKTSESQFLRNLLD